MPRPWNVMKPRIQRVLTQWNPGFISSGRGPNAVALDACLRGLLLLADPSRRR